MVLIMIHEYGLRKGWNNSGPVMGSAALRNIIQDIEKKVKQRFEVKY